MATAAVEQRIYTAEELYELPKEDGRCELVRGKLREMPFGSAVHGFVGARICARFGHHVLTHDLGRAFAAGTGFALERNPDTVRAPDLAFITRARTPRPPSPWFSTIVPDLVAEVVETDESYSEVMEKVQDWLAAGVRLVWVVDPKSRTVTAYRSLQEMRILTEADTLDAGADIAPGFSLPVAQIFA